jgi:hypothetical protein
MRRACCDGSGGSPDPSAQRAWYPAISRAITKRPSLLNHPLPWLRHGPAPPGFPPASAEKRTMSARRCGVVLTLLLSAAPAWSGEHDKEAYAAAQVSPQSRLIGFEASLALAIQHETRSEGAGGPSVPTRKRRPWEVVLDLSGHSGRHDDESDRDPETTLNRTQYLPLVGMRFARGMARRRSPAAVSNPPNRLSLFGQVLAGGVFTKDDQDWRSGWAAGGGLGLDYLYSEYGGLRVQFDIIGAERHKPVKRISLGLVYRFEHH